MADIIEIEILEDGTLSAKTASVSKKNHASADDLLELLEDMLGGGRQTLKIKKGHVHVHSGGKQKA